MTEGNKHRILVPVDGSPESEEAFDKALFLAERLRDSLTAVYIVDISDRMDTIGILSSDEDYSEDEIREEGRRVLAPFIRKANGNKEIRFVATSGAPALTITRMARDGEYNLIVMGNRGTGMVSQYKLGSVSEYVVENAACPVMIVKLPEEKQREVLKEETSWDISRMRMSK